MPEPLIGLGHSLGGNILLRGAPRRSKPLCPDVPDVADDRYSRADARSQPAARQSLCIGRLCDRIGRRLMSGAGRDEPNDLTEFENNNLTADHVRWSRIKSVIEVAPDLALGSPTVWVAPGGASKLRDAFTSRLSEIRLRADECFLRRGRSCGFDTGDRGLCCRSQIRRTYPDAWIAARNPSGNRRHTAAILGGFRRLYGYRDVVVGKGLEPV